MVGIAFVLGLFATSYISLVYWLMDYNNALLLGIIYHIYRFYWDLWKKTDGFLRPKRDQVYWFWQQKYSVIVHGVFQEAKPDMIDSRQPTYPCLTPDIHYKVKKEHFNLQIPFHRDSNWTRVRLHLKLYLAEIKGAMTF